jgi:hypothetical protein
MPGAITEPTRFPRPMPILGDAMATNDFNAPEPHAAGAPGGSRRRTFLGLLAGAAAATGTVYACTDLVPTAPRESKDADLIRLCAEHITNRNRYEAEGGILEMDDDPLWWAYSRTYDAINGAVPETHEGILAKARVAKAEAKEPDGTERPEMGPGCRLGLAYRE